MRNAKKYDDVERAHTEPLALTVVEAAHLSRSSRSTIYEALQRRELEGKKLGRRTIILREALETYLSSLPNFGDGAVQSGGDDD